MTRRFYPKTLERFSGTAGTEKQPVRSAETMAGTIGENQLQLIDEQVGTVECKAWNALLLKAGVPFQALASPIFSRPWRARWQMSTAKRS